MTQPSQWSRRSLVSGLGALAAAFTAGARQVHAQAQTGASFTPMRHPQDAWLNALPGKHRVVFDVTSAAGVSDLFRFVSNTYTGNKGGYGLEANDLAVVVILRHSATAFGYGDTLWSPHGAALAQSTRYSDPGSTEPPKSNPYNSGSRRAFDDLTKRGVSIGVCDTASHGLAGRLASAGKDAEATYKEMIGDMIPGSRLVPAGVVAVARAQEYGYSVIHVG
jgi:hypothetical protein